LKIFRRTTRRLILTGDLLISKDLTALGAIDCDHQYVSDHYIWPIAISLRPSADVSPDQLKQLEKAALDAERIRSAGKTVRAYASFTGRLRVVPVSDFPAELVFDSVENLKIEALPDAAELPVIPICDLFQNLPAWSGKRIAVRGETYSGMESAGMSGPCKGGLVTNGYRWPVALSYAGPAYYSTRTAALNRVDSISVGPKEDKLRGRINVVTTATYVGHLRTRSEYKAYCRPGGDYMTNGFGHLNYAAAELVVEAVRDVERTPRKPTLDEDEEDLLCLNPDQSTRCSKISSLEGAASSGCNDRLAEILSRTGIDSQDGKASPALYAAIRRGNEAAVRLLIEKGAPINPVSVALWSPLGEAAHRSKIRIMKLLLAAGADPEATDNHGSSFLPTFGFFDVRVTKALLDGGANVNARDDKGQTALMHAAAYGYEEAVKLLIEHRADVNLTDNAGRTALMHAAAGKYVDAIPHLLDHRADLYAKDPLGDTAVTIAQKSGNQVAFEVLSTAMHDRP
jgi:ankyrin repeat protein